MWSLFKMILGIDDDDQPDPSALPDFSGARNRAVIVGLGHTDPRAYNGWDGNCPGALLDARNMHRLCTTAGAVAAMLTDAQATKPGVKKAVQAACQDPCYGDRLILFDSGHGGQQPDFNGDEPDQLDETFCLWDGQVADDLMEELLCSIPAIMEVILITDCCHSGSNVRSAPAVQQVRNLSAKFTCPLVHIAGCADANVSYGSNRGGVLTNALLSVYSDTMQVGRWGAAAAEQMPANQIPVVSMYNANSTFLASKIFKL